ncbi:MAG: MBL fold metallo-hydrolase [Acidobacteriota bacterium]
MAATITAVRTGITNTYLIRDRGTVLIDPGGPGKADAVLRKLRERLGEMPRVDLIVVTHGHFDHIGAAREMRELTCAPLAIHRGDVAWLREGKAVWPHGVTRWGRLIRTVFGRVTLAFMQPPRLEPDLVLDDEGLDLEPYGVAGRVVATPGHSPGSVSLVLQSGDAFVGDLAMNGPPICLRPSFGIFAHQPEIVPKSWKKLVDLGVRMVYPAHGRPFPAARLAAATA